jgi:hypothetical protein
MLEGCFIDHGRSSLNERLQLILGSPNCIVLTLHLPDHICEGIVTHIHEYGLGEDLLFFRIFLEEGLECSIETKLCVTTQITGGIQDLGFMFGYVIVS